MDMRAQYRNNRVNTVGEGNPVIIDGDTGQDKEWIGLRLKKRERERILFLLPNLWPNCDLYQ